jgi:ATP-dependent exoDNAse (exonuclease V) beta subunit
MALNIKIEFFFFIFLNKKKMNKHARDALIEFDAGPHKYTCAGEGNYLSVTTWLHTHFPQFDADAIIAKMRLDKPTCKYYGQTPEQIKASWDQNRDEAAAAGTAMHAAIEDFFINGESLRSVLPSQFLMFLAAHPLLKPYRAEWMIFDEDVKIAGSIDFVSENADGTLTIYDWKRCKEIKKTNSFGDSALTECIAHLPDTNYWHYALQLNTYKTILERKYEKKVKAMFLVGLHPALPSYQLLKVPELRQEMEDLFALRMGGCSACP